MKGNVFLVISPDGSHRMSHGEIGELWIGGKQVARGYTCPQRNEGKFVKVRNIPSIGDRVDEIRDEAEENGGGKCDALLSDGRSREGSQRENRSGIGRRGGRGI